MLLARKLVSGKATQANRVRARKMANRLHQPKERTAATRIMTEETLSLGSRQLKLYQAILLVLASYDMPTKGVIPMLKGGTISTQYSARNLNVSNIDIQIMSLRKMLSGKTALKSLTANDRYWKLYFKESMTHVVGLAVAMVTTLNKLKGLKKAVRKVWGVPIERVAFKIRGSHVARPKKITILSVDLHIKTAAGEKESISVFDMVLGDARNPKPVLRPDLLVLKKGGKTLYQYKWGWISKDFETMVKNKDPKAREKREKRLSRWLEGLLRSPKQKERNQTKVFQKIDKFSRIPLPKRSVGEIRRLAGKYSDGVKTDVMVRGLIPA